MKSLLWKLIAVVVAAMFLAACDTPVGLGSRVDTSAPVIDIVASYGTGPGSFLSGTKTIYIDATDDNGINSVSASYWYQKYENGKLVEHGPITTSAVWDGKKSCYVFDINTTGMADGTLRTRITAVDKSGKKTVTPELIYTVKNHPPFVNMLIPRAKTSIEKSEDYNKKDFINIEPYPSVVIDNYISGTFDDLAGVAKGYPRIKFWKAGENEPGTAGRTDRDNAGWGNVNAIDDDPNDGWIIADEGLVEADKGAKAGTFRYYIREHDGMGKPAELGEGQELSAGLYHVKIQAKDVTGRTIEWPRDAYANLPEYMTIEISTQGTPPLVWANKPDKLYQRKDFDIEAEAMPRGDLDHNIVEMCIEIEGRNQSDQKAAVTLAKLTGPSLSMAKVPIQIGKTYYSPASGVEAKICDSEAQVPLDAYSYVSFVDGNYNFVIKAAGESGLEGDVPLTIYIDRQPPSATINEVIPYYSQDKIADTQAQDTPNANIHDFATPDPYRRWTVNSSVKISANSADNRGNANDDAAGYLKFKYLFLKNADVPESEFANWQAGDSAKTFGQYLYERADSTFFEETKENPVAIPTGVAPNGNPLIKVEGSDGAYTLVLQTHKWDAAAANTPYKLWLYIVAMDNAENINYQKILLNIDQDTDKPRTSFGNIATDGSTFMDDRYAISMSAVDDNGLDASHIYYRFAENTAAKAVLEGDYSSGWKALSGILSVDGLQFNVNNLTLTRIACDLIGHAHDSSHTLDTAHKAALGLETDSKYIQLKASDSAASKLYASDSVADGYGEWRSFTMDLTFPQIQPSASDQAGSPISRDINNPFITPQKDGSYQDMDFAYGDIKELNLKSITVKINGDDNFTQVFQVPDSLPTLVTGQPAGSDFAIWKTALSWDGELRFRIPMANFFSKLEDGSHTFEISFTDKVPQTTTKSLTFYKDSNGPEISLINPGTKIYISDAELISINNNMYIGNMTLVEKYNALANNAIKDASAKLIGNFSDSFSPVYSTTGSPANKGFWYKIDNAPWKWVAVDESNITEAKTVPWQIDLPPTLGDGLHRLSLRVKDSWGNGYGSNDIIPMGQNGGPGFETNLAFMTDRSIPYIDILTPYPFPDFVNGTLTMTGKIANTPSVKKLSVRLDGTREIAVIGTDVSPTVGTISLTALGGNEHDFSVTIPASELSQERSYSVTVTATGASDQSTSNGRNFTYDKTAPAVLFNVPSTGTQKLSGPLSNNGKYAIYWSGTWVTGQVKIGGTSDDKSGISKIYYHIGRLTDNVADGNTNAQREAAYDAAAWTDTMLNDETPAPGWTGGLYYWNYSDNFNALQYNPAMIEQDVDIPTSKVSQFYLPFYVKVVDNAGNINVVQYKIYVDPDMDTPQTTIGYPDDGSKVGGEIRITGSASDNNWVHSVEIRIKDTSTGAYYRSSANDPWIYGPAEGWVKANIQTPDMVVNWHYSINGDGLLNPAPGSPPKNVLIEARAIDTKDPSHVVPDLIGSAVSRSLLFMSEVPTIELPMIHKSGVPDRAYSDGVRVSGEFSISTKVRDSGGIDSIKMRQSGLSTFVEIVKKGEPISALPAGLTVIAPAKENSSAWQPGWCYYITRKGTVSNWKDIDNSWFDGKNYDTGVMIQYKYGSVPIGSAEGIKASGTRAVNDGDSDNWNSQQFEYTLAFSADSTKLANMGYGRTGLFTLELQVYNNNKVPGPYSANGTYTVGIDNFFPTMEIDTQYNAATRNFRVTGTAQDYDAQSGAFQALERVLVYFEKNGVIYNPRGVAVGSSDPFYSGAGSSFGRTEWATIPPMESRANVRDMTKSFLGFNPKGPNGDFVNKFPLLKQINKGSGEVWESPHAMVIDRQEFGDVQDSDGDGIFGEIWEGKAVKIWQAIFDTTLFTNATGVGDGPLTVHYIAMDQAGNATHYAQDIYIGNNKPLIREINLGTDINFDNNVEAWTNAARPGEFMEAPITIGKNDEGNKEHNVPFRVRNNLFKIRLDALFGNGTKHYRVSYVNSRTLVNSTDMVRGMVYTIAEGKGGNTAWDKYGAMSRAEGTTFVASGPAPLVNDQGDATTGQAWAYAYTREKTGNFANSFGGLFEGDSVTVNTVDNIQFTAADFGTTAGLISDSPKAPDGKPQYDRRFIVKVYDTTTTGPESEQLAHVALIGIDIENNDTTNPTIDVASDFGKKFVRVKPSAANPHPTWENDGDKEESDVDEYAQNIVTSGSGASITRHGYVQYGVHTASGKPDISGKVIFMGKAADNQRMSRITAQIAGYKNGAEFTIAEWGANGISQGVPGIKAYGTNHGISNGMDQWGFRATEQNLTLDYGHVLNWEFAWDSSEVSGITANNVGVTFRVYDTKTPDPATSNKSASAPVTVNIVPYVSEVITRLSSAYPAKPSAFNRSALGWYPVREDETIQIKGFNFNGASTKVTVNGTALNGVAAVGGNTRTNISARIDNNGTADDANSITSGELVLTVNGITSINNRNNDSAAYNQEPNGLNNNILNDDCYLYVWNTGTLINSNNLTSPFMRMDKFGSIYMSYARGTDKMYFYKDGEMDYLEQCYNKYHNTTVAFDAGGNIYGGATNTDRVNNSIDRSSSFTFYSRMRGSKFNGNDAHYSEGTNKRRLELSYSDNTGVYDINRVKIPRIVATGMGTGSDPAKIYMSYFDGNNKDAPVVFRYGTSFGSDALTGGISSNILSILTGTAAGAQIVADKNTTYKGGLYTAVGGLSTGQAVIAWYDASAQALMFSYSQGTNPAATTTNQWQANARVIDGDFAGWYVDMAVDAADGIHIAYYTNGNGGLRYAYLSSYNAVPQVVRVDTYLSAGTKIMITTRAETRSVNGTNKTVYVPYISYYHASFPQTMNSVRIAWRNNFDALLDGTDTHDGFTGAWEAMTVPTNNIPVDDFVCNGVASSGTITSGNLTKAALANTVLLGYYTDKYYERAYLKK